MKIHRGSGLTFDAHVLGSSPSLQDSDSFGASGQLALPPVFQYMPSWLRSPLRGLYLQIPSKYRHTSMYVQGSQLGSALFLLQLGAQYQQSNGVVQGSLRIWMWEESAQNDITRNCWWNCDIPSSSMIAKNIQIVRDESHTTDLAKENDKGSLVDISLGKVDRELNIKLDILPCNNKNNDNNECTDTANTVTSMTSDSINKQVVPDTVNNDDAHTGISSLQSVVAPVIDDGIAPPTTTTTSATSTNDKPADSSASSPFLFSLCYAVAYLTSIFWQHHINLLLTQKTATSGTSLITFATTYTASTSSHLSAEAPKNSSAMTVPQPPELADESDSDTGQPLLSYTDQNEHRGMQPATTSMTSMNEIINQNADLALRYFDGQLHAYSAYSVVLILVLVTSYIGTAIQKLNVQAVTIAMMPISTVLNYMALTYGELVLRSVLYYVLIAWHTIVALSHSIGIGGGGGGGVRGSSRSVDRGRISRSMSKDFISV